MANKRKLKKQINLICEGLFSECVASSLYGAEEKMENQEANLFTILQTQAHYISRISHPEPGMDAKAYYKDLREKFAAQAGEILDQLTN